MMMMMALKPFQYGGNFSFYSLTHSDKYPPIGLVVARECHQIRPTRLSCCTCSHAACSHSCTCFLELLHFFFFFYIHRLFQHFTRAAQHRLGKEITQIIHSFTHIYTFIHIHTTVTYY